MEDVLLKVDSWQDGLEDFQDELGSFCKSKTESNSSRLKRPEEATLDNLMLLRSTFKSTFWKNCNWLCSKVGNSSSNSNSNMSSNNKTLAGPASLPYEPSLINELIIEFGWDVDGWVKLGTTPEGSLVQSWRSQQLVHQAIALQMVHGQFRSEIVAA
ncbi:hypothetical protein WICPIJ_007571 [Wickerhamomyces pijperi]|uniref:Uncharacterized protein n=1 Tax=Wickerhamomyces pijperi TaxID=599730 RepID=A0A9P8Q1L8_WICPI|nr:hypothetical protein WICPIJ_007571 [Wickerhamomyces pijperi]